MLGFGHELGIGSEELSAANLNPSVIAINLNTLFSTVELLFGDGRSVVVFVGQMIVVAVSGRNDLYRTAVTVLTHSPLSDVEHVCTPVGHESAAHTFVPAPCSPQLFVLFRFERNDRIQIRVVVELLGERTQPFVPVQTGRNLLFGQVVRGWRASHVYFDQVDLSQFTFAAQIGGVDEFGVGTLLAADLKNTVVFTNGFAELLSLVDGQRQRFFEIYVFAGLAGCDGDQGMLVVGGSDHDGIDVGTVQQLLIVLIEVDRTFLFTFVRIIILDAFFETGTFDVVYVASGNHPYSGDGDEAIKQVHGLLSETDKTDINRVVGRRFAFRTLRCCCRQSGRNQQGSRCADS